MKNYDVYITKSKENINEQIIDDMNNGNNIILYGNNDYSNYCNAINYFRILSKKDLKYVRKIEVEYNSNIYFFNKTDVFVEVDFDLLGVNEYHIFMELYNTVRESYLQENIYILCNNFYKIRKELHNALYTILNGDSRISFIFLTSQIEFISSAISNQCKIYKNIYNNELEKEDNYNLYKSYNSFHYSHKEKLLSIIIGSVKVSLKDLRDIIYEILIYNFDVYLYLTDIIESLLNLKYINDNNVMNVLKKYTHFIEKYNNNYRAVFHLEYFIIYLMNLNGTQ